MRVYILVLIIIFFSKMTIAQNGADSVIISYLSLNGTNKSEIGWRELSLYNEGVLYLSDSNLIRQFVDEFSITHYLNGDESDCLSWRILIRFYKKGQWLQSIGVSRNGMLNFDGEIMKGGSSVLYFLYQNPGVLQGLPPYPNMETRSKEP